MPHVLFAFEFESEWPNGNSVTKQSTNYHLSDLERCFVSELPFGHFTDFIQI